jgi:hypothetical protein
MGATSSGDNMTALGVRGRKRNVIQAEVAYDKVNMVSQNIKRIKNNRNGAKMHCFMIGGTNALVPTHFFRNFKDEEDFDVTVEYPDMETAFLISPKHRVRMEGDLTLVQLGVRAKMHKSIVQHFIRLSEVPYTTIARGMLVAKTVTQSLHAPAQQFMVDIELTSFNTETEDCVTSVPKGYRYDVTSQPGVCGSILIVDNSRLQDRIIGLHVGGGSGFGYSTICIYEKIMDAIAKIKEVEILGEPKNGIPLPPFLVPAEDARAFVLPAKQSQFLGTVPRVHSSTTTKIRPSRFHRDKTWPKAQTEPAVLSRNDPRIHPETPFERRDPMYNCMQTKVTNVKPFPSDFLEEFKKGIEDLGRSIQPVSEVRVRTVEEAINGTPEPHHERMNMATSPGYLYKVKDPPGPQDKPSGKFYLFENTGTEQDPYYIPKSALLQQEIKSRMEHYMEGELHGTIFMNVKKDERLKLKKIYDINGPNTREFCVPPVDFTIVQRQLFLDFMAAMINQHNQRNTAVGMDVFSSDWTMMIRMLRKKGAFGWDGDYNKFDRSLPADVMILFTYMANAFYNQNDVDWQFVHDIARHRSILQLIQSTETLEGLLFFIATGQISGNVLTTMLNDLCNLCFCYWVWWQRAPREKRWFADFKRHVAMQTLGDDNILVPNEWCLPFYNMTSFQEELGRQGITYTPADKGDGIVLDYKDIYDLGFLKCTSRKDDRVPDVVHACMAEQTIYELPLWYRDNGTPEVLCVESNCNDALGMAYHYGEAYFNTFRVKLFAVLRNQYKGYEFNLLSYQALDERFFATFV